MQTLHFFAGAGGGLLADLILGHTPIGAVELDPYCCRVLRERAADGWFPELRVHEGDVRLFDPSEYAGRVDCLHAGFPCHDISLAGARAGVGPETRSGLYREVLRVAGVVRPRYLFLENVAAIVAGGLVVVLADLAALGYDTEWLCLRASDCGAPHRRDRWWCLARNTNGSDVGEVAGIRTCDTNPSGICETVADTKSVREREPADETHAIAESRETWDESLCSSEYVAHSNLHTRHEGRPGNTAQIPRGRNADRGGERASIPDTILERLEGQQQAGATARATHGPGNGSNPGWWQVEPDVGRVVTSVAARVDRLKALGNGQVPIQAALAWRILGGP